VENRTQEQQQTLALLLNLVGEQYDPLTLIPTQTSPTLAAIDLANPTDQQILSIITGNNPDGAFQTVAKYSNPFASDTATPAVSLLQPTVAYNDAWTFDAATSTDRTASDLTPQSQTSNSLTLEQLSRVESTAVNLWQNLLTDNRQLDVSFQITDLADGQIAQAQVTKFSSTGLATGGTILIDRLKVRGGLSTRPPPIGVNLPP
jgi:hypothetical protein